MRIGKGVGELYECFGARLRASLVRELYAHVYAPCSQFLPMRGGIQLGIDEFRQAYYRADIKM